jgi:putative acetyltransferase
MESDGLPVALDVEKVGSYPARAGAGGGFVWDEVLEYRVWLSPLNGAEDLADGSDYFYAFASADEAISFAAGHSGTSEPLALVLQREYLEETTPGEYTHVVEERVTEWPLAFLSRPRRTADTIPAFLAPDAPVNRLDILRGLA